MSHNDLKASIIAALSLLAYISVMTLIINIIRL
jgi:hypothetical protein